MKIDRKAVHAKYNGHCAYCGKEISLKQMQVDHIIPIMRSWEEKHFKVNPGVIKGTETMDNYNPACARCNRWKSTFTLDQFRKEVGAQVERVRRDSSNFRMAEDFGMIEVKPWDGKFYFEKQKYCRNA